MRQFMKYLGIALLVFAAYLICTGVLPYLHHRKISDDYAAEIENHEFYGNAPCVDRVALVEQPMESLEARIHILDEAQETLDISYYAMHMGDTTDLFLGSILRAAERGVKVRILVDGMSGGLTSRNKDYAVALGAHPNVELKLYNSVNILKPWTINGRLHDKYIIVDDRLLLLGGRNIGDKYFNPEGFEKNLSIDRDVLVYNTKWNEDNKESVLFDVRDYMNSIWDSENVKSPFEKDTEEGKEKRKELIELILDVQENHPKLFNHKIENYENRTFEANKITFLNNGINIGQKEPRVGFALDHLLREAKESVMLQSPYIILERELKGTLNDIGSKNLNYQILTNSMASSPNMPAYSAYMNDRKKIIGTGAKIFEYQSRHAIHAKTYLIDDRMAVVGSYNLDPRSARIDTELMLAIDSPEFTKYLRNVQQAYQDESLEVGADGKYIDDSEAEKVPTSKKIIINVCRVLVRMVKFLT